jgi:hypothetical protein
MTSTDMFKAYQDQLLDLLDPLVWPFVSVLEECLAEFAPGNVSRILCIAAAMCWLILCLVVPSVPVLQLSVELGFLKLLDLYPF